VLAFSSVAHAEEGCENPTTVVHHDAWTEIVKTYYMQPWIWEPEPSGVAHGTDPPDWPGVLLSDGTSQTIDPTGIWVYQNYVSGPTPFEQRTYFEPFTWYHDEPATFTDNNLVEHPAYDETVPNPAYPCVVVPPPVVPRKITLCHSTGGGRYTAIKISTAQGIVDHASHPRDIIPVVGYYQGQNLNATGLALLANNCR
jgi:hypothetical protein